MCVYIYVYTNLIHTRQRAEFIFKECEKKICMYVSMYLCIYVCMYVWMYVCMDVWMYECMYECMFLCMDVRTYVCIYYTSPHDNNTYVLSSYDFRFEKCEYVCGVCTE